MSWAAAITAAALADPTYTTLLAAPPLVEVARRAPEPERTQAFVASGTAPTGLISTE